MGTIGFLIPKNMGIDIKIVTLALLEAKLWPNMWFRWRPFWMCYKTRLRGGKNWTPIFLAHLTPNEAIKTIKSILATEMAKMTYRTRLHGPARIQLSLHLKAEKAAMVLVGGNWTVTGVGHCRFSKWLVQTGETL